MPLLSQKFCKMVSWLGRTTEATWACQRPGLGRGRQGRREHLTEKTQGTRQTLTKEISSKFSKAGYDYTGDSERPDLSRAKRVESSHQDLLGL